MNIKDYFEVLWRRKWIVILAAVGAFAIAVVGTALTKPAYQATATLRVAAAASGSLNYTASTYSNELINTAAQIASSRPVRDEVISRLKLTELPVITSAVVPNTELIKITVEYSSAQVAAQIANTLTDLLIAQSNELYTGGKVASQDVMAQQVADYKADLDQTRRQYSAILALTPPAPDQATAALDLLQLKERNYEALLLQYNDAILLQQIRSNMMTVVEPAIPVNVPVRPQVFYNYIVGLAMGLLAGVIAAFLADSFDPTLQGAKDVENATALTILAKIPKVVNENTQMAPNDRSSMAEAFRKLAMDMILADHQHPEKVLMIMSAEPKQGKSMVTANLATALAEYGKKIVTVDCDMRRPTLHKRFNLPNESGLSNILGDTSDLKKELRRSTDSVTVLTSGGQPINPSQLLSSPRMANVISALRQQFDFILLDTPALAGVSDAAAILENADIAQSVDALILVVRQAHAQHDPVQSAGQFVRKFPTKAAGVVLNQADGVAGGYYYQPTGAKAKA